MSLGRALAVATVWASALGAAALAREPASTRPAAGKATVTWPLPDDATFAKSYAAFGSRYGFNIPDDYPQRKRDEWLAKTGASQPTYELYVPPGGRREGKVGLLVWISAGPRGNVPREDWLKVLERHRLIWVGPNHAGNETDPLLRAYLATEAVRHAKQHFPIDDARVYVAGFSGGGRVASHLGFVAPETFAGGGFYLCGADFYRDVPEIPGDKHGKHFRGFWRKPDLKTIARAKRNRFVLLTGSDDFNRVNTNAVYDGYLKSKFPAVVMLTVPGLAHEPPDAGWFEKGVRFLDDATPTTKPAAGPTTRPRGVIRVGPGRKPVR